MYNVAVVGVGAVGEEMIRTLKRRKFPVKDLRILARSERAIKIDQDSYHVQKCEPAAFRGMDIALFAGTEGDKGASAEYARAAARGGTTVIDNSSYFRMEPDIPLVVPEVNPEDVDWHQGVIANPNCSTIQMLVALKPIHDAARLKRVIVSTYQAVSGAGRASVDALTRQVEADAAQVPVPTSPDYFYGNIMSFNVVPQIDSFAEMGYTKEEWKMVRETQKIFHDSTLPITATTVRVPVYNGHSESVYVETERKLTASETRELLRSAPGIVLVDDPESAKYITPREVTGRDEVFVSRVREDPFIEKGLSFWVVADNLLKGAATNAVQIAEELIRRDRVHSAG
jgi:aspartate-semialdehyde dehydrogenase